MSLKTKKIVPPKWRTIKFKVDGKEVTTQIDMSKRRKSPTLNREDTITYFNKVVSEDFWVKGKDYVSEVPEQTEAETLNQIRSSLNSHMLPNYISGFKNVENENVFDTHFDNDHSLRHRRVTDIVFRHGDKITLTRYDFERVKDFDTVYTRKNRNNQSLTFNLKSGCFYYTGINIKNKSQTKKTVRKNAFETVKYFSKTYSDEALFSLAETIIKETGFNIKITLNESTLKFDFKKFCVDWFVRCHNIKATDNFQTNFVKYYPGLKYLRRTGLNFTESMCKKYDLKGKRIRKIMNVNDNYNIFNLKLLQSLFDINVFNRIPEKAISNFCINEKEIDNGKPNWNSGVQSKYEFENQVPQVHNGITYQELFDIFTNNKSNNLALSEQHKFINLLVNNENVGAGLLIDHIVMRNKIFAQTGKRIKMTFRDMDEFNNEHALFSKILGDLRLNYYVKITYSEEMLNLINQPLTVKYEDTEHRFKVILLDQAENYREEGLFQHHCVGGYSESKSHIVSLRYDDKRMTSEYRFDGSVVQNRMAFNKEPVGVWELAKNALNSKMNTLGVTGQLEDKVSIRVPLEDKDTLIGNAIQEKENYTPLELVRPPVKVKKIKEVAVPVNEYHAFLEPREPVVAIDLDAEFVF